MWSNGIEQNRETDEKQDKDYVEEKLQLARVNFDKDVEGGREALRMGYCHINIWDGWEPELSWSRKIVQILKTVF